jgi:hypothetical protein
VIYVRSNALWRISLTEQTPSGYSRLESHKSSSEATLSEADGQQMADNAGAKQPLVNRKS